MAAPKKTITKLIKPKKNKGKSKKRPNKSETKKKYIGQGRK